MEIKKNKKTNKIKNIAQLTDEFYSYLKESYTINLVSDGWMEIGTPLLDAHNDGITVYLAYDKDANVFRLSDDGFLFEDLSLLQNSKYVGKINNLLNNFLDWDVSFNPNNEILVSNISPSQLFPSIQVFAQQLALISNISHYIA